MPGCSMERGDVRRDAETAQFADHLARTHFLRLCADGRPAFLVPHALVQDLPDQSTESVGDGPNRLGMSEAWDDLTVDDGKDRPLGFHRGVSGLVEDASHLP